MANFTDVVINSYDLTSISPAVAGGSWAPNTISIPVNTITIAGTDTNPFQYQPSAGVQYGAYAYPSGVQYQQGTVWPGPAGDVDFTIPPIELPSEDEIEMAEAVNKWRKYLGI